MPTSGITVGTNSKCEADLMRSIIAIALAMGMSSFSLAADKATNLQAAIPDHRAQPAAPEWQPTLKKNNSAINSAKKSTPQQTLFIHQGGNTRLGYRHRRHNSYSNFMHREYGHSRYKYRDLSNYWGIGFSKHRKFGRGSKHRKFGLTFYGSLGYFRYQFH